MYWSNTLTGQTVVQAIMSKVRAERAEDIFQAVQDDMATAVAAALEDSDNSRFTIVYEMSYEENEMDILARIFF